MTAGPLPGRDHDLPASAALLAEAGAAVLIASLAIRTQPFDRLAARLDRGSAGRPAAPKETAYWVRRAVSAWGRRLPWRAKCFEQGLAAAWMLRRRGLAYALHYGASKSDDSLAAHVWVTSGETPVVGCENREQFSLLTTFSG